MAKNKGESRSHALDAASWYGKEGSVPQLLILRRTPCAAAR